MSFLKYTKELANKIKYYDSLAQKSNFGATNPFAKPREKKVIWIDNETK